MLTSLHSIQHSEVFNILQLGRSSLDILQVVPSRQVRGSSAAMAKGRRKGIDPAQAASTDAAPSSPADPADLLPRTDISPLITDDLLRRLGSANWKVDALACMFYLSLATCGYCSSGRALVCD